MQVINKNKFTILLPDKGYKLVNKQSGETYKKIYLGINDSADNYAEEIDEKYINPEFIEQNELTIDLLLYTIDELYTSVEPLLAMVPVTLSVETEEKISRFIGFYVLMVKRGIKDIEDVPERYREQVRAMI